MSDLDDIKFWAWFRNECGAEANRLRNTMSDYEKVMDYLREGAHRIMGEWNGDESGEKEMRATYAADLLEALDGVDELVKELDI